MIQVQTLPTTKDIVKQFAAAVEAKEFDNIKSLLADDGEFCIQNKSLDTETVGKEPFLTWFYEKLQVSDITSVDYDNCILCKIGNPVVIFNKGLFPRKIKDSSEKSMTGLMLDIKDGLIHDISFCYSFAHRENQYQYECNAKRIDELIKSGVPEIDAYTQVLYPNGITNQKEANDIQGVLGFQNNRNK